MSGKTVENLHSEQITVMGTEASEFHFKQVPNNSNKRNETE